jgi:uncharacterized protein (DUF2336 family)
LTQREHLPIGIAERLVARVSEELKAVLVKRHDMATDLADDILDQSRELATLGLIMPWSNEQDVMTLVKALDNGKRLTATIMLRSLCMGDIAFFEAAMARLSKVSLVNIRLLIHDQGQLGFKAVRKIFFRYSVWRSLFSMKWNLTAGRRTSNALSSVCLSVF